MHTVAESTVRILANFAQPFSFTAVAAYPKFLANFMPSSFDFITVDELPRFLDLTFSTPSFNFNFDVEAAFRSELLAEFALAASSFVYVDEIVSS
jgi:hypothetical protein